MQRAKKPPASERSRRLRLLRAAGVVLALAAVAGRAELRELNTDRPDVTESPFTIDPGHWQIEMDLANHTRNQLDGVRTREWDLAPLNLRYGLTKNVEAGIFLEPYDHVAEEPRGGPRTTTAGFGDLGLRTKINFTGNDGGETAFGLIFDLKLPTAASGLGNGHIEGGVILPFSCELPHGWDLGAMTELDLRFRDEGGARGVWVNSVTVGHAIAGDVAGYGEVTSTTGIGTHVATLDFGVTWKVNANTQLDAGVNFGISRAANDCQLFVGLSRRF